jgi:hypothetical protein
MCPHLGERLEGVDTVVHGALDVIHGVLRGPAQHDGRHAARLVVLLNHQALRAADLLRARSATSSHCSLNLVSGLVSNMCRSTNQDSPFRKCHRPTRRKSDQVAILE